MVLAFLPIALVIVLVVPLDSHLTTRVYCLAVVGGALNGLGALTSFKALESGGKASIVIPLCYLYPLVTIFLALIVLHGENCLHRNSGDSARSCRRHLALPRGAA